MKLTKSIFILVLTLFLAACNVNPSTATSSNNGSLISSSQVSATSIELTTSSSLTQFLGLNSRVIINANLNTNAVSVLEWYVNNERSLTQTGLTFEFFPNTVNTYQIYAKSGNTLSNTITVTVSLPKFNLTNVEAKSNSQLEIKAEPGLTFGVSGLTIASTSSYNIVNQVYTINLLTPMIQGNTYNITASRPGFESSVLPFLYETRRLSVNSIIYKGQRIIVNAQGVYELQKPFTGAAAQNYTISLTQTNLEGINVPISIVTNVPAGATAIAPFQSTIAVQKGFNITRDYTLTSTTEPGIYVHNISVNNVNLVVRVSVSNPNPSLALTTPVIYDLAATSGGGTALGSPFATDASGDYLKKVVKPDANGQYTIFRPYNGSAFELTFILTADNFPTPLGFPAAPSAPYSIISALVGPSGGVMYYGLTVNTLTSVFPFRESTGNNFRVSQYVDNKTTLGTYTYTFTASGFNLNLTRSIVVNVREYTPTIEPVIVYNDLEVKPNSDGSYTIFKPLGANTLNASIGVKVSNYESPFASLTSGGPGITTLYNDGASLRYLLDTRISYSGPLSAVTPLVTKIGIELGGSVSTKNVTSQVATPITYKSYVGAGANRTINLIEMRDEETYTTASNTNIFDPFKTLSATSFPGVHTFTIQIGGLSRTLILRVVEPTPLIIIRDDVVEFGVAANVASKDNVSFNETDNKYYVDGKNGFVKINVYPFGMPSGDYPYTFTRSTPSGTFQSNTNTVALTLKTSPSYDGTLTFPDSTPGSEMKVVEQLVEEGEYIYTFNINNQFKEIRVVVLPAPQLKVESVKQNLVDLPFVNGIYYINHATTERFIEFTLVPINTEPTYKYLINNTGAFPVGTDLTSVLEDLVIVDGKMVVGITLPARSNPLQAETHTYLIALYKGSVRVGTITNVVIISQPINVSVFFNANGGTTVSPITQFAGTTISTPSSTRVGYQNPLWFNNEGFSGSSLSFPYTLPTSDIVLHLKWTAKTHVITFNKEGGTGGSDNATATFDAAMPVATAPTRAGFVFGGYFTQANGAGVQYYSSTMVSLRNWDIDSATNLLARWTPVP